MPFGKQKNPVDEFFSFVIETTAHSIDRSVTSAGASELARDFLNGNFSSVEARLGVYVLIPQAYDAVRNWQGCSAGTCNGFLGHMRQYGWESLAAVDMLLGRPRSLLEAHQRMWEGVLKPKGIVPSAIQREYQDAEKYLSHMLLHATTDLVYALSGQNRPFAGRPSPLRADVREVLGAIVRQADRLTTADYFVAKEVDGLKRMVAGLV